MGDRYDYKTNSEVWAVKVLNDFWMLMQKHNKFINYFIKQLLHKVDSDCIFNTQSKVGLLIISIMSMLSSNVATPVSTGVQNWQRKR